MRGWSLAGVIAVLVLAAAVLGAPAVRAHEGHDHGAPPPPVSNAVAPRAVAASADFELVPIARGTDFVVHLDAFRTNAPITDATIEIDTSIGVIKPAVRADGTYAVTAPFLKAPGTYDLAVTITARGVVDILATTLNIPAPVSGGGSAMGAGSWFSNAVAAGDQSQKSADPSFYLWITLAIGFVAGIGAAGLLRRRRGILGILLIALSALMLAPSTTHAEGLSAIAQRDIAQRFADGSVFVPKTVQQILAVRTVLTAEQIHNRALELPGRIVPSPKASGLVRPSMSWCRRARRFAPASSTRQ